mgnify:CR=1 FL=1
MSDQVETKGTFQLTCTVDVENTAYRWKGASDPNPEADTMRALLLFLSDTGVSAGMNFRGISIKTQAKPAPSFRAVVKDAEEAA